MLAAALIAAALLGAQEPDCGVIDLPHIDRAAYEAVNGMTASATAGGRVSTRFFAEPLASALEAEYARRDRGEAARLSPEWLTEGGPMDAVTDRRLYSLNRSGVTDIVMLLGFTNAEGEKVWRRLSLGCYDGRWRIRSIFLGEQDGFLSEVLARNP